MKLPSYQECVGFFEKCHVPINFLAHCKRVAQIGRFIAEELSKKGVPINPDLVERAGLLHDLFKFVTLDELKEQPQFKAPKPTAEEIASWKRLKKKYKGMHEVEITYLLLKDFYPELAQLIVDGSDHKRAAFSPEKRTWEERVQHYADWRVLGDTVVTFQKRIEDALKRYGETLFRNKDLFRKETEQMQKDEKEIFSIIGLSPDF